MTGGWSGLLGLRPLTLNVSVLRSVGGEFHQELWAGNAILLRRPSAEVGELAAFRAEWTPAVAFPGGRSTADRAGHCRILPHAAERRIQLGRMG